MIKSEKGRTEISGSIIELSAELDAVIRGFRTALKNGGASAQLIESIISSAVLLSGISDEDMGAALEKLKLVHPDFL